MCFRRPLFHFLLHYYIHIAYKKLRITQTSNKFITQLRKKIFIMHNYTEVNALQQHAALRSHMDSLSKESTSLYTAQICLSVCLTLT